MSMDNKSKKNSSAKNVIFVIIGLIALLVLVCLLLVFVLNRINAGNTLSDGEYNIEVTLEGGSGRATINSPANLTVENGKQTLEVVWSSPNYDYMKVGGKEYEPVNTDGNSVFLVPCDISVELYCIADTVAMSKPHEIEYTIKFNRDSLKEGAIETDRSSAAGKSGDSESGVAGDSGDNGSGVAGNSGDNESGAAGNSGGTSDNAKASASDESDATTENYSAPEIKGEAPVSEEKLSDAKNFRIFKYADDITLIHVYPDSNYILCDFSKKDKIKTDYDPDDSEKVQFIERNPRNCYLAATAAMSLIDRIDAIDSLSYSSLKAEDWYVDNAEKAMEEGSLTFAGKYSEPDFEMLTAGKCPVAIESMMIEQVPDVKEKLESLGIPVIVDRSSSEDSPLGRLEWVKFYGTLFGKEHEANTFFESEKTRIESIASAEKTGKKAAFFYVNSKGEVVVRASSDYVSEMIRLAGADYTFEGLEKQSGTHSDTVHISMEEFISKASDSDYLFLDGTIVDTPSSIAELTEKYPSLATIKAIKDGSVYVYGKSMYQATDSMGDCIEDMHKIFTGSTDALTVMKKLL